MRILLLEHPRQISEAHFNDIANTPLWSCLMTGYAGAALVRAGFEVETLDAVRMDSRETVRRLTQNPLPDFLAVHAVYFWEQTESLFRMLSDLRTLGFDAPICLYGFFPGLVWKEILDYCAPVDFVVVGEPEETLVELARSLENKPLVKTGQGGPSGISGIALRINGEARFTGPRPLVESPDGLAFPLRPSLDTEETVSVLASRGCYNNCSFCLVSALELAKTTWRGRSVENIASEISGLVSLGKRDFYFVDPNFVGPGKEGGRRTAQLARRLAEFEISFGIETRANDLTPDLMKELAGAGLTRLLLGIESARPEVLKRLGKHTSAASNEKAVAAVREVGIEPDIGFIMFDAESTLEDVRVNLEFLERNCLVDRLGRTANLLCHDLIALKGTRGYTTALENNLIAPRGFFGFEGRLLYRDQRAGWLASAVKSVCLFVLREMGKPLSPIHWSGESPAAEPYRAVNDLLVDIFKRLTGLAERFGSAPDPTGTERLLSGFIGELESAFNLPRQPSAHSVIPTVFKAKGKKWLSVKAVEGWAFCRVEVQASSRDKSHGRGWKPLLQVDSREARIHNSCQWPKPESTFESNPVLPKLKRSFPFRIATTSYILPDEILPNVRFLGKYFDEVELVLFESGSKDNLPTGEEVLEMARVASDLDLSYNVHLPSDLFFADPDRALRQRFCETALSFYERTLPLSPSCYVLHLDSRRADRAVEPDVSAWSDRVCESLRVLESKGMDLGRVAVENLEYPVRRVLPVAADFDLSICLDMGHLLRYGHDLPVQSALFFDRIALVHLHGVDNGKDHKGLAHIPDAQWRTICGFLEGFCGGVSLEVFSLDNLAQSCNRMLEMLKKEK